VPRLIRDGKFLRPTLGIQAAPVELLAKLGLGKGVPIVGVVRGGPADHAGLQPFERDGRGGIVVGDVIVASTSGRSRASTNCSKSSSPPPRRCGPRHAAARPKQQRATLNLRLAAPD